MPNYVMNILKIGGDIEKIDEVLRAVQKDDVGFGSLDFNKIIPMPESLKMECGSQQKKGPAAYTDYVTKNNQSEQHYRKRHPEITDEVWAMGKQSYENFQKYGAPTWYEWRNAHWGTKWNAFEEGVPVLTDFDRTLSFRTAWSMPEPILLKLSEMMPEAEAGIMWADEDIGRNCGIMAFRNGEVSDYFQPKYGKESVEYAAMVWGGIPANFHLRLNKEGTGYEYFDENDFSPSPFDSHEQSGDEPDITM